jgi:putative phage-type endonuclease
MSLSPYRAGRLTASVFASAIGIGYDSRQKLWRQLTGREERFAGNTATAWGHENEKHAILAYEVLSGEIVEACGDKQGFVIHPEHDWLGCTPDGYVTTSEGEIVIEAKCPASMQLYGKVPDHYMPQVQGQMAITERNLAHFICWTPEAVEVYEVPRNEEYWKMCFEFLNDFWQCVQNDVEPSKRKKPTLPQVNYERIYHAATD